MRKVTKIDAAAGVNFLQSKLRVAAYCRVSTDGEDQLSSLENQTTHYTKYIKSNPEWEFAGLYFEACDIIEPHQEILSQRGFRDMVLFFISHLGLLLLLKKSNAA